VSFQWFRMWVDAMDDEKLKLLAFEDRWHFVAICCCKRKGILDEPDEAAMRDRKVGAKLGLADRERDEVRRRLVEVRLIDENWQPLAWGKRQFLSDADPTASDRKRKQRDRERHGRVTRDTRDSHAPVTDVSLEGHAPQTTDIREESKIGQTPSAFDRFWKVYPKKVKRKTAEEIWRRKRLDPRVDSLLADVGRRLTEDRRWLEGYVPDPTTYLNQERWNDELQPQQPKQEAPRRGLPVLNV
jgi:hypothetical protein